jgi:pyridoxine 4-dehydrogenase
MSRSTNLGGAFTPAGTNLALNRIGYGAIQLTGPMAFGPPPDRQAALAVVREAVRLGINHIDTSDYYGPHVANEIIREAIHPYPKGLVIVTKVGARRGPDKSWPAALSRGDLTGAVQDNLRHLGLDVLEIVNLRVGGQFGPNENSIAEPLTVLADLQAEGLIRHIGLSNISPRQFVEAQAIAKIVCVQTITILPTARTPRSSIRWRRRGLPMFPFSRWAAFAPCNPRCWMRRPLHWAPRPVRWRWPGCCSTRPTS